MEERGATATNPKMIPRQQIGSGNSIEMSVQKEVSVSESCKMVGCSRLPGSHGLVAWKTSDNSNTVQTVHLIHARASHRGRRLGVIP